MVLQHEIWLELNQFRKLSPSRTKSHAGCLQHICYLQPITVYNSGRCFAQLGGGRANEGRWLGPSRRSGPTLATQLKGCFSRVDSRRALLGHVTSITHSSVARYLARHNSERFFSCAHGRSARLERALLIKRMAYFLIVSRQDVPLYEVELSSTVKASRPLSVVVHTAFVRSRRCHCCTDCMHGREQKDESSHLHQFILHAALDMVEERLWDTGACYLKVRQFIVSELLGLTGRGENLSCDDPLFSSGEFLRS